MVDRRSPKPDVGVRIPPPCQTEWEVGQQYGTTRGTIESDVR